MKIEEVLEYIVKKLVDQPNNVKINKEVNELGVLLTFEVHKNDIGTILGNRGSHIDALRNLIRSIGLKNKSWVSVKLNLPDNDIRPERHTKTIINQNNYKDRKVKKTAKKKTQTIDDVISGNLDDLKI